MSGDITLPTPAVGDIWGAEVNAAITQVDNDVLTLAASLPGTYESFISVSDSSGDVAAIQAALATGTSSGFVSGKWRTQQGKLARITQPTTIALGYSNTQAASWSTDTTHEKVKLSLDILPDAGLGAALTIKGGYGVELDINVLGGGAAPSIVTDAATGTRNTSADGHMTALDATKTLTSASGAFVSTDVGATIAIPGAGGSGVTLFTTIATVVNSTTVTLGAVAQTTVTASVVTISSLTVSSPNAIAAGLNVGSIVQIVGAGPAPEGIVQELWASVRTVNVGAGTFTVSEAPWAAVSGATMRVFDVAVRVEDLVGLKLNIYGKGFGGYLFAADATGDVTKRIRSSSFESIIGNGCGSTFFWKSIEAFGTMGKIISNTNWGDYVGLTADLTWDHYEGGVPQPTNQDCAAYLWFDRAQTMNAPNISVGDRATECAVKASADSANANSDMGRLGQVRCTMYQATATGDVTIGTNTITNMTTLNLTMRLGQTLVAPGVPDGALITAVSGSGTGYTGSGTVTFSGATATASATAQNIYGVTSDGVKLIGVQSLVINMLDTARCVAGLRVIGGGNNGITVMNHKSLTSDLSPLVVQPGSSGTTPRVDVKTDYRFMLRYAVDIAAGLASGAEIRIPGYSENMHISGGASGKYAVRCGSTAALLDISNHHQKLRSGLTGFVNTATVLVAGRPTARLDNEIPTKGTLYFEDGAGNWKAVTPGPAGQVVGYASDGSGGVNVAATPAFTATDTQRFTANGTWTKPTTGTPVLVHVRVWGPGGGGGSGARMASGTLATGGGGGGAGAYTDRWYAAADLPATVSVTVGGAGTGGAAVTTDSTAGNPGVAGGQSVFGSASGYLGAANGGALGAGGTNSGSAAGGSGATGGTATGGGGGASSGSGTAGAGGSLSVVGGAGTGGGSGGGITTGAAASAGGAGGSIASGVGGGAAGAIGANGTDGGPFPIATGGPGMGGGGGGSAVTGTAGHGGAGGTYGAGGGGGGSSLNGIASGAGGTGAGGLVIVDTYF